MTHLIPRGGIADHIPTQGIDVKNEIGLTYPRGVLHHRGMDSTDITTHYLVSGMTCGHCVASVSSEITSIPGVTDVTVDLVRGGDSRVTVRSGQPLEIDRVRAAIDEAGFVLA